MKTLVKTLALSSILGLSMGAMAEHHEGAVKEHAPKTETLATEHGHEAHEDHHGHEEHAGKHAKKPAKIKAKKACVEEGKKGKELQACIMEKLKS